MGSKRKEDERGRRRTNGEGKKGRKKGEKKIPRAG